MARQWIEWHGGPCPVAKGTLVDVRYLDGSEFFRIPALMPGKSFVLGEPVERLLETSFLAGPKLYWDRGRLCDGIVAYRLSEDPNAEADRINARQSMFHDWLRGVSPTSPEGPRLPLPKKEGVR